MRTVGEILKTHREKKGLSIPELSEKTRIQEKYIKAIEGANFGSLPPATFVKGFIQNYAKAVGVEPSTALAIFRRDYLEDKKGNIVPRGFTNPIQAPTIFTPKTTAVAVFAVIATIIVGFFAHQIYLFYAAPRLEVTAPLENTQAISPILFEGQTQSDSAVTVNSKPVLVSPEGNFSTQIQLPVGEHTIAITATSRKGKSTTVYRTVTVRE